jgi:hypothetical protein
MVPIVTSSGAVLNFLNGEGDIRQFEDYRGGRKHGSRSSANAAECRVGTGFGSAGQNVISSRTSVHFS